MKSIFKNERGSVIVLVAAGMVMLMGLTALATDIGMMTLEKSRLQNAVDAAALAGAQELPDSISNADSIARDYVNEKNASGGVIDNISFSQSDRKITVEASKEVPFIFAKVLGISQGEVNVKASAIKAIASGMSGLRPFGVFEEDVDLIDPNIDLMVGSWDNEKGNFGAVRLAHIPGGSTTGGSVFEKNIATGSGETYYIGDHIDTEPGGMTGPEISGLFATIFGPEGDSVTYSEGMEEQYPNRVIVVPVVDLINGAEVNGKTEIEIVGFAAIFVEGYTNQEEEEQKTIDELLAELSKQDLRNLAQEVNLTYENSWQEEELISEIKKEKTNEEIESAYTDLGFGSESKEGKGHLVLKGHFLEILEGYEPDTSETSYGVETVKLVE